jgi:hypothetical protein
VCLTSERLPTTFHSPEEEVLTWFTSTYQIIDNPLVSESHQHMRLINDSWTTTTMGGCQMLLRKEVIQPHLPVRLPCYDFVPIASPTFDSSLRKRLGHWLRVLPTFMT